MDTIKQHWTKSTMTHYKWALAGIMQGDLNKVEGFNSLDSSSKNLIAIYKAQITVAARNAGITLQGKELADDFAKRLLDAIKSGRAYDRKTIADSVYGVDSNPVY